VDERIMNIVSLIADQVQTRKDLFSKEGPIMDALINSGYRLQEVDATLTLLQSLARPDDDADGDVLPQDGAAMRAMSTQERARFTIEAFGFLTKLGTLGIISADLREELIEKALALHSGRIELVEVKTLLALELFSDAQEYEDLFTSARESTGTSWN
jgi:Smg protein